MANWELTITNSSGKGFKFKSLNRISPKINQNFFDIALPGQKAKDTILFSLSGQERSFEISFRLKNYGEDLSIGHSSSVTTLIEQFDYIINELISTKTTEIYTFKLFSPSLNKNIFNIKGLIGNFSPDFENDKVAIVNGSFSFREGSNPFNLATAFQDEN